MSHDDVLLLVAAIAKLDMDLMLAIAGVTFWIGFGIFWLEHKRR